MVHSASIVGAGFNALNRLVLLELATPVLSLSVSLCAGAY